MNQEILVRFLENNFIGILSIFTHSRLNYLRSKGWVEGMEFFEKGLGKIFSSKPLDYYETMYLKCRDPG